MEEVIKTIQSLDIPFWHKADFWIFLVLSIGSLIASVVAFLEARQAKKAAHEVGKTVKIQTITIELSEIIQKLDKLNMEIDFPTTRDLLNEINRRVRRLTAPFKDEVDYKESISIIQTTLNDTKTALDEVRPLDTKSSNIANAVYHAIEPHFSDLSGHLAELMGNFEKRTLNT